MASDQDNELKKQLAKQQEQIDALAKEVAQFRSLALAAYKDVEPVRTGKKWAGRLGKPVLPVFRAGRSLIWRVTKKKNRQKGKGQDQALSQDIYDDHLRRYTTLPAPYNKTANWYEEIVAHRKSNKSFTAVITSNRGGDIVAQAFAQARAFRYANLQIFYVANASQAIMSKDQLGKDITQFIVPEEKNLGSCLNLAAERADGDYLIKLDDDDFYGPDYVAEAAAALAYDFDFIGKWSVFYHFEAGGAPILRPPHGDLQIARHLSGATFVMRTGLVRDLGFSETLQRGSDSDFVERAKRAGVTLFSTSAFNFAVGRRENENHTWQIDREALLQHGVEIPQANLSTLLNPVKNAQVGG